MRCLENQTMLGPSNGGMEGDEMKEAQIKNHKLLLANFGMSWGALSGRRVCKGLIRGRKD